MRASDNPLISIIVPVYKTEDYLSYCLDSLLNQTYKNIEIIVVNDGSPDNSQLIIDNYKKKSKNISSITKENGGLSDARNFGMSKATGDYYVFVDSDDYVASDYIENLHNTMATYNADIAQGVFKKTGNHNLTVNNVETKTQVLNNNTILEEYFNSQNDITIYHNACGKIYKSSLFDDLKFKKGIYYEDLEIQHKLLSNAKTFVTVNNAIYYYYQQNANSITNSYKPLLTKSTIDICNDVLSTYKNTIHEKSSVIFSMNQCIHAYEMAFINKNTYPVDIYLNKLKKIIIRILKSGYINKKESVKILIRLLFPYLHKYYKKIILHK